MADDRLNRLLRGQGSVDERTRTTKTLGDEELQMAVPYSEQAKVEWERRDSARRDAREEETLSIARRALANSEQAKIVSVIAAVVATITAIVAAIISRTPA